MDNLFSSRPALTQGSTSIDTLSRPVEMWGPAPPQLPDEALRHLGLDDPGPAGRDVPVELANAVEDAVSKLEADSLSQSE
jgi:hypothetical protein